MTIPSPRVNPDRYHEASADYAPRATALPVCLYLETTNRCNLLCTTCPRTFDTLEPEADMSWELFTRIVDQIPDTRVSCCMASASRCWSKSCRAWCAI